MPRILAKFPLILGILLGFAVTDTFAIEQQRSDSESPETLQVRMCNFNKDTRTYNIADLLLCMNELSRMILLQQNTNQNRISDRMYQDTRQSHPVYAFTPDYSIPSNGVASLNHYAANTILSLLSGGLPLTNLPNLFNFSGFTRPGFNLFSALSSIAQYDDLKCIPRILCEVASGSMPRTLGFGQSLAFQDSSINTLIRLFTTFDIPGTSPILSFGRAALIGYINRGKPHSCYQAYPRCPQNSNQLISYLNNYNGGFFRFFSNSNGNYYRPQQSAYHTYNRNSDIQNTNIQSNTGYESLQTFSELEADRTGTGKLTFDNDKYREKEDTDTNIFPIERSKDKYSKLTFPKDK